MFDQPEPVSSPRWPRASANLEGRRLRQNVGYRRDCGRFRGTPCRAALRPTRPSSPGLAISASRRLRSSDCAKPIDRPLNIGLHRGHTRRPIGPRRRHSKTVFPRSTLSLAHRVQYDYRYLALSLQLIVGIRRPKFERLFPKSGPLVAHSCPGPRLHLLGPGLDLDIRVGEDIAVPPRVFGRATLRRDYKVTRRRPFRKTAAI